MMEGVWNILPKLDRDGSISYEELRRVLRYNPVTGLFKWRVKVSTTMGVGKVAGTKRTDGYIEIGYKRILYKAHRLAWLYMEGYMPEVFIDHINRKRDDNRWNNLREVSQSCSVINRNIQKNNTSGITGVRWCRFKNKWIAFITKNKKLMTLESTDSFETAVKARWEAEKRYNWSNCMSTSPAYLYLKENNIIGEVDYAGS